MPGASLLLNQEALMPTARDIMTPDVTCIGEKDSLTQAARKMAELDVGALPICGEDNRLKGMLTDRDIVVRALGQGRNPDDLTAGELAEGKPVTIGADDDVSDVLRTMSSHQVRRLPVIDGHDLVGMVAVADVARALSDRPVGDLIDAISKP
jgi:CBS domain-containing protein